MTRTSATGTAGSAPTARTPGRRAPGKHAPGPRASGGRWRRGRPGSPARWAARPRRAVAGRGGWRALLTTPAFAVLVLAGCSFAASLVLQAVLYPQGSGDADEAAYVLQAHMLLDGRLTLDARVVEPFFRPWLTGVHDGQVFTKYLPGWPAALAASQALFGTMTVAPAAVAVCWVVGTYRLARELFGDAPTALAAAVLVALSPLVLLHTALPLAYACATAALTLASAALLRGVRTGARTSLVAGGAGVGFVLLIRPYDAALVMVPLITFAAVRLWRGPRTLLTGSGWAALGAAPLVAILLAFCWRVTGSPLRMPLSASDPLDRFGFGPRRILPSEPSFLFTRRLAVDAFRDTLDAAPSWYFGGMGLIALAVVGLLAPRHRLERLLLASTTGIVLAGYAFWWGSAFAMPGLRDGLGPHYHLAAFTPVVILAAAGGRWLWSLLPGGAVRGGEALPGGRAPAAVGAALSVVRSSALAGAALRAVRPTALAGVAAGLVLLTLPTLPGRIDMQRAVNQGNTFLDALIPDDLGGPAVILVTPGVPSRYTQVPYHMLRNSPDLDGPVVYAADIGAGTAALPDRMPDRRIYRLRPDEIVDPAAPASLRGSFVPLRQVAGTRIEIRVTVRLPEEVGGVSGSGGRLYVRLGGEVRSLDLPPAGMSGAAGRPGERRRGPSVTHTFVLTAGSAAGSASGADQLSARAATLPGDLVVGFAAGDGSGGRWEERFPLARRESGDLSLLAPGLGWRQLPGEVAAGVAGGSTPDGRQWFAAPVKPTLDVALTGHDDR